MKKKIGVIWGDGSSPEIVREAIAVLDTIANKYGHEFEYTKILMGGEAIDVMGEPLPQSQLDLCRGWRRVS